MIRPLVRQNKLLSLVKMILFTVDSSNKYQLGISVSILTDSVDTSLKAQQIFYKYSSHPLPRHSANATIFGLLWNELGSLMKVAPSKGHFWSSSRM